MVGAKKAAYIPERGDIVWLNSCPQTGHEQAGRRPALVVSDRPFNRSGLFLVCAITSKRKGNPFEIHTMIDKKQGSILSDHIKSLDWQRRDIQFIGKASGDTVMKVQKSILSILLK